MSNLQVIARRCPIMSKALAVQSVRYRAASTMAANPTGTCKGRPTAAAIPNFCGANLIQKRAYVAPSKPANLQATPKPTAQADTIENVHMKAGVYDTSKGICPHGAAAMKAANAAATNSFIRKPPPTSVAHTGKAFDYEQFYQGELDKKHKDKSYRYFNNINRLAKNFPKAHMETEDKIVTVFCSNDYV